MLWVWRQHTCVLCFTCIVTHPGRVDFVVILKQQGFIQRLYVADGGVCGWEERWAVLRDAWLWPGPELGPCYRMCWHGASSAEGLHPSGQGDCKQMAQSDESRCCWFPAFAM